MDASTVDFWIMIGTLVMAFATLVLATAAIWAATVAIKQLKAASSQIEQSKNLADAAVQRQRAEITHSAVRRFMKLYEDKNDVMIEELQKFVDGKSRDADNAQRSYSFEDIFVTKKAILEDAPPKALEALRTCLDCLEELAVGVELRVYDEYVIYHAVHKTIARMRELAKDYITLQRDGGLPHHRAQPTAYIMLDLLCARLVKIGTEGAPSTLAGSLSE